jgi:hypothetical protein
MYQYNVIWSDNSQVRVFNEKTKATSYENASYVEPVTASNHLEAVKLVAQRLGKTLSDMQQSIIDVRLVAK